MNTRKPTRLLLMALALCGSFSLAGCSSTSLFKSPASELATSEAAIVGDKYYSIQVFSDWGKPRMNKVPITGPTRVQEALEEANAIPRFGSLDVVVHRVVPENGQRLKLVAEFDDDKKAIETSQDYQLRPNDHIIVKPSSKTPLDDLMGPITRLSGG